MSASLLLRRVESPEDFWLIQDRAEMGRLDGVDVVLEDPSISKLHAMLEWTGDEWRLADMGSKNGTRLNGSPLQGSVAVRLGDRIELGNVELVLESVQATDSFEGRGGWGDASLLLRVCQSLLQAPDLDAVLQVALDEFLGLTQADRGAVLLLAEDRHWSCERGRHRSDRGKLEDLAPEEFEFTETLASTVVEEGRTRIVLNACEDAMLSNARSVMALGVSGAVCVPLLVPQWGGKVQSLGVLYGDSVQAIISAVPLDLLEGLASIMALAIESARNQRDLLEQSSLLESRVQERTAQLEIKHRQLLQSEKMAATGLLAAGVAHELGNALLQVSANVHMIHEFSKQLNDEIQQALPLPQAEPPLIHELITDLRQACDLCLIGAAHSERTVRDLKTFARLDEAKVKRVDLNESLETVARLVEKGVGRLQHFQLDLQPLPRVWCYPERLNQVFLNLFVNAVQASRAGQTIWAGSMRRESQHCYFIRDEGCGIPPENLARIFDPFFTTKKVGEGSGLGLSLAYQSLQEHHGSIQVESTPGQGTTFFLLLPDWLEQEPPPPPSPEPLFGK